MMLALLAPFFLQASAAPLPGYWQQRISYTIDASLDESRGVLEGTEHIVYHNHSPDTLRTFSLHLYLNAFRPGSRWSDADSAEHRRRFNDLKDPDYGYNRIAGVTIMGRAATATYPFAPDSTIVRFELPEPLAPGDSLIADLEWSARPSTVPRRQGRRGRAYDFAQWYPRVVAYDKYGWEEHPLYPAGEFYGDFGDFTVKLDVPEDQVVGATGVPLCGDPGWERANRKPDEPVDYRRDTYPDALSALGSDACTPRGAGRKTIVWRAEDVHHFALSMNPEYRYEGGRWGNVTVHVLYQPGDEKTWGGNVAVGRTQMALEWLDGLFGPFPWPQITNVHRIESGGTEFPMMIHDGSADLGLILHELGHNYVMGILANNEWREGWMDEGFTTFQTNWFYERHGIKGIYQRSERQMLGFDLDGWSEPTSLVSERYRDFVTYNVMIYNRGALFFHQLKNIVGDSTMHLILRTYYDRWKLKHVDEGAFKTVAEEVSKRDLSTFFAQWLHSTVLYDYAVRKVKSKRQGDGWVTRVEVVRKSPGVYPVEVVAWSKGDSARTTIDGLAERSWVELVTKKKPDRVLIDPEVQSHDWNMINNRARRTLLGWDTGDGGVWGIDRVFSTDTRRDRVSNAVLPTVWYNTEGGATVGGRLRSNYLGRYDQYLIELNVGTRDCCRSGNDPVNIYARLRNPTWLRVPRLSTSLSAFSVEGRAGAQVAAEYQPKGHLGFGPTTAIGGSLQWVATENMRYLDPAQYEDGGTVETELHGRWADHWGAWDLGGKLSLAGGVEYRNDGPGVTTMRRYDAQGYFRGSLEVTAKRTVAKVWRLGLRGFGGVLEADHDPLRQRWFFVAGADPYQQLTNPFTRSRGSLLTDDIHFQTPGGGDVRGIAPSVAVRRIASVTAELDRAVWSRPNGKVLREVRLGGFGDVAVTDGFYTIKTEHHFIGDAGVGARFGFHLGDTDFITRIDLPLVVSHPDLAVGSSDPHASAVRFRWTFSIWPTF